MNRGKIDPIEFGVDLGPKELGQKIVQEFSATYGGTITSEDLLFHPREAVRFCDEVRRKHGWYVLPDDIILRFAICCCDPVDS